MPVELQVIAQAMRSLTDRLRAARHDESGYTTETVVVTALLVALAVAAVGIIAAAVVSKAKSIQP
jgi:hypothetical protein